MTARHRVSKMLLRHGRVYPESSTWTVAHRRWLAAQQFQEAVSDLVFADLIAAVDGLSAREAAIAERLSRLAEDEQWWLTVARLRCFRGVDTDRVRASPRARRRLAALPTSQCAERVARADPIPSPVWGVIAPGGDHEDGLSARSPAAGRVGLALRTRPTDRGDTPKPSARPTRPRPADRQPCPAQAAPGSPPDAQPREGTQRDRRRVRTRAGVLPLGSSNSRLTQPTAPRSGGRGAGPSAAGTRESTMSSTRTRMPRPFLDSARWQHETGPWGTQPPHHQTGNADTEPGAPASRPPPPPPVHQVGASRLPT
jgi:hypothetical protein